MANADSLTSNDNITKTANGDTDYNVRLQTYDHKWTGRKNKAELARAGFCYTGVDDKVECHSCGLKLLNWHPTDNPLHEHATRRPLCSLIKSICHPIPMSFSPVGTMPRNYGERLYSFVTWRGWKCPSVIARAGFCFTGEYDKVVCPSCGLVLVDWSPSDDPLHEHVTRRPKCPFINSSEHQLFQEYGDCSALFSTVKWQVPAVLITDDSDTDYDVRLQTYDHKWTGRKNKAEIARAGFCYTGDKVECPSCGLKLLNWTPTDDPLYEHATRRPLCSFINSRYRHLRQNKPPKHPQYQELQARIDSFVGRPELYDSKPPEELAAAGFFYRGSADRVTCFQCGIILKNWGEQDDPVTEHQRYSENCQFINKTDLTNLL